MKTNRLITKEECPWLKEGISAGTQIYKYSGCTYGSVSRDGTAVSLIGHNKIPFVEIPTDAIDFE